MNKVSDLIEYFLPTMQIRTTRQIVDFMNYLNIIMRRIDKVKQTIEMKHPT